MRHLNIFSEGVIFAFLLIAKRIFARNQLLVARLVDLSGDMVVEILVIVSDAEACDQANKANSNGRVIDVRVCRSVGIRQSRAEDSLDLRIDARHLG